MTKLSVVMLVLVVFVAAATLRADTVLRGTMDLTFHPENLPDGPIWIGTISGDINGDMSFINTGGAVRGMSATRSMFRVLLPIAVSPARREPSRVKASSVTSSSVTGRMSPTVRST